MAGSANLNRGFTLLELITVIVILGVLLVLAASRMNGGRGVRELGYAEQFLSDLRIAQRRAEADRCEVRVAVAATSVTIEQRAALCSGPFNRAVAGPRDKAGSACWKYWPRLSSSA